jgi:hypothetical protein
MSKNERTVKVINQHGPMGWILFTAYIGAAIYFYQQDPGFVGFIVALLKAAVWPAYVLFEVMTRLAVN